MAMTTPDRLLPNQPFSGEVEAIEPEKTIMAINDVQDFLKLVPVVKGSPQRSVWLSYDAEADTLYVNLKKPSHATDSELTDNDIIVRYEGDEIVGLTVLHASQRA